MTRDTAFLLPFIVPLLAIAFVSLVSAILACLSRSYLVAWLGLPPLVALAGAAAFRATYAFSASWLAAHRESPIDNPIVRGPSASFETLVGCIVFGIVGLIAGLLAATAVAVILWTQRRAQKAQLG